MSFVWRVICSISGNVMLLCKWESLFGFLGSPQKKHNTLSEENTGIERERETSIGETFQFSVIHHVSGLCREAFLYRRCGQRGNDGTLWRTFCFARKSGFASSPFFSHSRSYTCFLLLLLCLLHIPIQLSLVIPFCNFCAWV